MNIADEKLQAAYLPANCAWTLVLGTAIVDLDGKRFFETRQELEAELRARGLAVQSDGTVVSETG